MIVFIPQCLLLLVCYSANGLKKSRILGNLCALFEKMKMFCQLFAVSKFGNVPQERLWCMLCERIFDSVKSSLAATLGRQPWSFPYNASTLRFKSTPFRPASVVCTTEGVSSLSLIGGVSIWYAGENIPLSSLRGPVDFVYHPWPQLTAAGRMAFLCAWCGRRN